MKIIKPTITGVLLVGLVSFFAFGVSSQTAFEKSNNELTLSVTQLKQDTITTSNNVESATEQLTLTLNQNTLLEEELRSTEGFLP